MIITKQRSGYFLLALAVDILSVTFLTLLLTGCITVRPELKPNIPPLVVTKKIPLKIALVVPSTTHNLTSLTQLPRGCLGQKMVEPAGYGLLFEQTVKEMLSRVYEQVDLVQSVPKDSTYHAILEASLLKVGYRFGNCPMSPENYVEIDGALKAFDLEGREVWRSEIVTKRQDTVPIMGMYVEGQFDRQVGAEISSTVTMLVTDWIQDLARLPNSQWAKGSGGSLRDEHVARRDLENEDRTGVKSDVDDPPAAKPLKKKNAYAVVIGIEQYREKLPKADFADKDAKLVGEYLTKVLGYPEENVIVRLNERATRTDLVKYFEEWLKNNVEPGGSVFIYYSGHGAPNIKTGEAYLVPYDGDPSFTDSTAYPVKQLYAALDKLPAKDVTVVLDSCFSGAGGRSVLAKGARPMVLSIENPVLASGKTVVLAASGGDQISNSFEEQGHGLLTYFFLKGLQGDGDINKDGVIEMAELFNYLKPNVQRIARKQYNSEQTPQLLASPDALKKGAGRLVERSHQ